MEAVRHNAIVSSDPDDPQKNRAWCPACGWRAKQADYGMADAWGRARAHNRSTRPVPSTTGRQGATGSRVTLDLDGIDVPLLCKELRFAVRGGGKIADQIEAQFRPGGD